LAKQAIDEKEKENQKEVEREIRDARNERREAAGRQEDAEDIERVRL
jgi:hypothetical protein